MREIKFRGKRVDNGEWVYGALVFNSTKTAYHILEHFTYTDKSINNLKLYEVFPSTVGQYTGLKDKNGTEIYEGDIVWCRAGEHAWGTWEYEKQFTVEYGWTQEMWEMMQAHETEIIGNIHNNPELLGGAE